jgi:hypothetical protein
LRLGLHLPWQWYFVLVVHILFLFFVAFS